MSNSEAQPTNATSEGFSIGIAVRESLGLLRQNFLAVVALTLAIQLLRFAVPSEHLTLDEPVDWAHDLIAAAVLVLMLILTKAALLQGLFRSRLGHRFAPRDVLQGIRRLPALLVAEAIFLPAALAFGFGWRFLNEGAWGLLGLPLIAIGGVLMCMWWLHAPAIIVENRGPIAGLKRSQELTLGWRWGVLGMFWLVAVVGGAPRFLGVKEDADPLSIQGAAALFAGALAAMFNASLMTVTYHHMRLEKERALSSQDETAQVLPSAP